MSDKIQPHHLERLAIIYVRQSTPKQVRDNKESRLRQRALSKRANQLGWDDEKVLVLEEEKAQTASSTANRSTYRKVSELVCQNQVGIILAVEVSRWSRDSVAWQLLLRDCVFGCVLLSDEHAIYDPDDPRDHVSLGIQGVLAEYELRMMRERMLDCWWKKARRGEIFPAIGTGYVAVPGKGLKKHPNARVQNSLGRMFQKFNEMPSVLKLCQWYHHHDKLLPYVEHGDPDNVKWLPADYKRMLRMLKNPVYTGAYVLGRTETFLDRTDEGEFVRRRRALPPDQWKVIEKYRHPAYISWEQHERNLTKIKANSPMNGNASPETARRGASLLSGMMRCARCTHHLSVAHDSSGRVRYICKGGRRQRERGKQCLSFSSRHVDPMFAETMLEVVRPAGIEAARRAAQLCSEDYVAERQSFLDQLKQFEYEAERAQRQYDRVEPENRLVAAELETCWNEALAALADARTRLERFERESQPTPSDEQFQQLTSLGKRLECVWFHEDTDAAIKQQIVRLLVREIVVDIDMQRNEATLWIHWTGGHHTKLVAPRGGRAGHSATVEAKTVIGTLRAVCNDVGIAHALNRNGVSCESNSWTAATVRSFRERHGIKPFDKAEKQVQGLLSQEDAAQKLGISAMSVHRLIQSNILAAEQPSPGLPSIIRAADLALPEVEQAVRQIQSKLPRPLPADPNQQSLF